MTLAGAGEAGRCACRDRLPWWLQESFNPMESMSQAILRKKN
jgi:hypothetical protein